MPTDALSDQDSARRTLLLGTIYGILEVGQEGDRAIYFQEESRGFRTERNPLGAEAEAITLLSQDIDCRRALDRSIQDRHERFTQQGKLRELYVLLDWYVSTLYKTNGPPAERRIVLERLAQVESHLRTQGHDPEGILRDLRGRLAEFTVDIADGRKALKF